MAKLSLKDLSLKGKKVLLRVDFNVPLENGKITNDSRIKAAIPTIEYILEKEGSIILMSHLGRPKGKPDPKLSLAPIAKRLEELIFHKIIMANDCISLTTKEKAKGLKPKEILLLENLRFYEGEETPEKDPSFAKNLAELGSCYVNDAFGAAHRKHASTFEIAKFFPKAAAMGFLMEKEINELSPLLENPKRPFYAIIGGAKVSSKIGVIEKLLKKVDLLFIGGGMIFTFLKADKIQIGNSLSEDADTVKAINRSKLVFPDDTVIVSENGKVKTVSINENIPEHFKGVDIGPKTIQNWSEKLKQAATVFWNGPLGVFEEENFSNGTKQIATVLAKLRATKIVGGGDSVAAIEKLKLQDQFSFLSTGGGASLEFLEYGHLPGIDVLTNK